MVIKSIMSADILNGVYTEKEKRVNIQPWDIIRARDRVCGYLVFEYLLKS